jgi:hypothetical protein
MTPCSLIDGRQYYCTMKIESEGSTRLDCFTRQKTTILTFTAARSSYHGHLWREVGRHMELPCDMLTCSTVGCYQLSDWLHREADNRSVGQEMHWFYETRRFITVFTQTWINFSTKMLTMEGYVTAATQFMRLTTICQGNGCPERAVLSRMEETRHAYVSLTGNVHEGKGPVWGRDDNRSRGKRLWRRSLWSSESCKTVSFGVSGVEFSGLSESYFLQPSNFLSCIRTRWPTASGRTHYDIYISAGGRSRSTIFLLF